MSIAFVRSGENEFREALVRLRDQTARIHSLLSELDRTAPVVSREPDVSRSRVLGARIVEAFGQFGCQVLECAVAAAAERAPARGETGPLATRR